MAVYTDVSDEELESFIRSYDIGAVMAIGYQGDPSVLPPELRERETAPRTRNSLSTFVFDSDFGQTAEFLKK